VSVFELLAYRLEFLDVFGRRKVIAEDFQNIGDNKSELEGLIKSDKKPSSIEM